MKEVDFICDICGNKKFFVPYNKKFMVVECNACHYGKIDPLPQADELTLLYNSPAYFAEHLGYDYKSMQPEEIQAEVEKEGSFHYKYLKKFISPVKNIFEIGPGGGFNLKYFADKNIPVQAIEFSKVSADFSVNTLGLPVQNISIEEFDTVNKQYHVIMLNHVFEHFTDIRSALKKIRDCIEPGGYLYLRVPDHDSYDRKKYKQSWPAYLPYHISYFSKKSMLLLLAQFQFAIINVTQYVSEKFMKNYPPFIRKQIIRMLHTVKAEKYFSGRTITILAKAI